MTSGRYHSFEKLHPQLAAFLRHPAVDASRFLPALVDGGVHTPKDLDHCDAHEVSYELVPPLAWLLCIETDICEVTFY